MLRPISPTEANLVCATCDYSSVGFDVNGNEIEIDIPDGTTVTITLPVQTGVAAEQTADYLWNGTSFNLTSAAQVSIPTLAAGQSLNYTVTVDLPSVTSPASAVTAFDAYSIPVIAYVNNDTNTTFDFAAEGEGSNIKIDRLYAGYLKLTKEVQVRYANGTTSGFVEEGASLPTQPGPGDTLEYRITYENIATPATGSGTGNILLPANSVEIVDNGLSVDLNGASITDGNNWALDNDTNGAIDTSHVTNGATAQFGTIQFFNGNPAVLGIQQTGTTAATDVTQYINNVGTVNPGNTGTFTFQRKIN